VVVQGRQGAFNLLIGPQSRFFYGKFFFEKIFDKSGKASAVGSDSQLKNDSSFDASNRSTRNLLYISAVWQRYLNGGVSCGLNPVRGVGVIRRKSGAYTIVREHFAPDYNTALGQ
jgi:hypothetical protein